MYLAIKCLYIKPMKIFIPKAAIHKHPSLYVQSNVYHKGCGDVPIAATFKQPSSCN